MGEKKSFTSTNKEQDMFETGKKKKNFQHGTLGHT